MDTVTNMESDSNIYTEREVAELLGNSGETPISSPNAAMKAAKEAELTKLGSLIDSPGE